VGIAPKAHIQATFTPAKARGHRSRLAPKPRIDQHKPPTSVGAANQPIQAEGRVKADLVVSTRAKKFKRTPPNQAGSLVQRKKAYRILKRQATNPIQEDQASAEDYQKIQEDISWAKAVIPEFDIAKTPSDSNKRERSMEVAQLANKKAKTPQSDATKERRNIIVLSVRDQLKACQILGTRSDRR